MLLVPHNLILSLSSSLLLIPWNLLEKYLLKMFLGPRPGIWAGNVLKNAFLDWILGLDSWIGFYSGYFRKYLVELIRGLFRQTIPESLNRTFRNAFPILTLGMPLRPSSPGGICQYIADLVLSVDAARHG
jgi:hypothetical protein